jgi:hypothetical protein
MNNRALCNLNISPRLHTLSNWFYYQKIRRSILYKMSWNPQAGVSRHCLEWTSCNVLRKRGKNKHLLLCFSDSNSMLIEWYETDLKLLSYTLWCPLSDDTELVSAFLHQPCLNGWFIASIDKMREISVSLREFFENRATSNCSILNLVEKTILFGMAPERAWLL